MQEACNPAQTILVTGANGFVGKVLCDVLVQRGANVIAVVRDKSHRVNNTKQVVKSIDANADWKDALTDVNTVVHLAARVHVMQEKLANPLQAFIATNVDGTINLAKQAASAGVKRFVYVSTVKVNGEYTTNSFSGVDQANPQDDYAISKWQAEQALAQIALEYGVDFVVIRPPLVYGLGVKANFLNLIKLAKIGLPLPLGAIKNKRSLIFVKNLVDFLVLCTHHPKAANETFLISDDDDVSTTQLITSIVEASGRRPHLIPIPQKLLEFGLTVCGKKALATRLCGNLQVDITKAKTLLGWQPPYKFKQGIADSIQTEHQV
jgi:nucleoside-diphosphate-sugar epimerase